MKKRFLFIVIILTILTSGLFAKEKRLFTKKTNVSLIELYQDNSVKNGEFCLITYEKATDSEYDYCQIISNNETKIKEFLQYLLNHNFYGLYAPIIVTYEATNDDLKLNKKDLEIDSKKNTLTNKYVYFLE